MCSTRRRWRIALTTAQERDVCVSVTLLLRLPCPAMPCPAEAYVTLACSAPQSEQR